MKRLLYTGAALSVISIFTYFNLTNIANWWVAKKDAQEQQEFVKNQGNDTLPYFKNQYIVTFPTNLAIADSLRARLTRLGLHQERACSCLPRITLWVADPSLDGLVVDLEPDSDPPIPPTFLRKLEQNRKMPNDTIPNRLPNARVNLNDYSITRNYKIIEPLNSERVARPLVSFPNRYAHYLQSAPKVIVATLDSGVDPSVPGVNSSLYRNSATSFICQPPTIEGIYGWNTLNKANIPSEAEPIDRDEKCFGWFSVRRGHGTLINGIIAGMGWYPGQVDFTNNANVNIQLLNVRFVDERLNRGSLFEALCGINYALEKGAKVINVSWRLPIIGVDSSSVKATFRQALSKLKDSSAILVACAGNDNIRSNPNLKIWPAAFSRDVDFSNNVIAVGGWDSQSTTPDVAPTSNQASFVDVYAPSMHITMVNRVPPVSFWRCLFIFDRPQNGTSFATPFVTRQVAILMGNPALTPSMIKAQIVGGSAEIRPNVHVVTPAS
jgi:subtilisin family serine protease